MYFNVPVHLHTAEKSLRLHFVEAQLVQVEQGTGSNERTSPTHLFVLLCGAKRDEATQQEVVSRPAGTVSLASQGAGASQARRKTLIIIRPAR